MELLQTRLTFTMPHHACDSHIHLIGPHDKFPLARERLYTPGPATLEDLRHLQQQLGLERAVVVHATPQEDDNSYLLHALTACPATLRGVASPDRATFSELRSMRRLGVAAIRLNLETGGLRDPVAAGEYLKRAARQAIDAGLHVQLHAGIELLAKLAPTLERLSCVVVIDHFGRMDPAEGLDSPNFLCLLSLIDTGRIYIKLSAFHRVSRRQDYEDLGPAVHALCNAAPHRLLWGSDWPHPQRPASNQAVSNKIDPYRKEDDGRCLNLLSKWISDEAILKKILVTNPQELFEF